MDSAKGIVHVVDDDASIRIAITRLLGHAGFEAHCYGSAAEYLLSPSHDLPGCLVLDVGLPGLNGMDLHAGLAKKDDAPPVVFLTGRGNIAMGVRAMKAGAVDFLSKPIDRNALLDAVGRAVTQDAARRCARDRRRALVERYESLTPRERVVFARVALGKLNKVIAAEVGTSIRTVKAHRASVMKKLELKSVSELINIADELRIGERNETPPGG